MPKLYAGIGGVLANPDDPAPSGSSRDSLGFAIVEAVADMLFLDDYEIRDIVRTSWQLDYPLSVAEAAVEELVFLTRSDNSAGPLTLAESEALLSLVNDAGRAIDLDPAMAAVLAPRLPALILPGPCAESMLQSSPEDPLNGVAYGNVAEVLKRVALLGEAGRTAIPSAAHALLDICQKHRLVLSVR